MSGSGGQSNGRLWFGFVLLGGLLAVRRRSVSRRRSTLRAPRLYAARRISLCLGILVAALSGALATGCTAAQVETVEARRSALSGDSPLVAHFRDAESRSGVPAELLATIAFAQSRLTQSASIAKDAHDTREVGIMALSTTGADQLGEAARISGLSEAALRTDARANIVAASAWLRAQGNAAGVGGVDAWWPAVARYGGAELVEEVRLLLTHGWDGTDEEGRTVRVAPLPPDSMPADGIAQVSEPLGYPGATFTPAAPGNYAPASRGAGQINYVVIHTIQGSYSGAISWFKNPSAKVSSHYVVRSSDGRITQMVDDSDIAYHDGCFNSNSIGIEHEGFVDDPGKWYTDAMYRESAKLTAWLCDKYNIPKDRQHILGHNETPDCSDHTDPGSGWDWNKYMNYVKGQTCKAQCAWDGNLIQKDCSV
ncbi:MAG TPA: N-acetylmuramoyl-L-alanine amidase, partial [Polyangiaceae bacterium]|nr:N-acetylmuramoyl-L-alanine amidase [Polyangiaceae bacterium]